jgi:hypothetical protein
MQRLRGPPKKAADEAEEERVAKELRTRRTTQLENSEAADKNLKEN